MTARMMRMAAATTRQINLIPLGVLGVPSLMPANFGAGRFAWEITAKGYGYPGLSSAVQDGLSVWDWDATRNRYVMSNFSTIAGWRNAYSSQAAGNFCFVNASIVIAANNAANVSSGDTKAYRAITTIGAAPSATITFTTPMTYAYDEAGPAIAAYSSAVGYSGNALFGYSVGPPSTPPAADGWLQKLSSTVGVKNTTALRSGMPTDTTHGYPAGTGIAGLGGATPNGYVVVEVSDDVSGGSTGRYQMVNCTGTPVAIGTQVSFVRAPAGALSVCRMLPFGAATVLVFDSGASVVGAGRASLLTANSATVPTTLAKTVDTVTPAPIDFPLAQLSSSSFISECNASNNWFAEGKALVWLQWQSTSGQTFARPAAVTSTGSANLSVTIPLLTIDGAASPVVSGVLGADHPIIAAPGGKAVVMVPRVKDGNPSTYDQYVYQL
jgi:hypothetical protein